MYGISGWIEAEKRKKEKKINPYVGSGQMLFSAQHDWINVLGAGLHLKLPQHTVKPPSSARSSVALSCDSAKVGDQQSERRSLCRRLTAKECN